MPRDLRADWLRKWRDGAGHWWAFLHEREELLIRDGYRQLVRHCSTAFADALWLRFRRERIRELVRGPAFVLVAASTALALTAIGSGGFRTLRTLNSSLPYPDPARLVTVLQPGVLGVAGIPGAQVRRWNERSRTLSGIAAYHQESARLGYASANLFSLLGVRPALGRVFEPGDHHALLLSYSFWQRRFGGDRNVVGRSIPVENESLPVIGVLPPADRMPGLPDTQVWSVTDPDDAPSRYLFRTVARLKPGVTREKAAGELARQARAETRRLISEVRVWPLQIPLEGRALLWTLFPAFGLVVGVVLVAIGKRSPVAGHLTWRRGLRCWCFLIVKTSLVLGTLTLFWIEALTAHAVRAPESDLREFVSLAGALVPTLSFLAGCALATLWCVADQRKRCPVCLSRLALPVTLGSWSRPLLDPVTTELVCERGHGSLSMPETDSSSSEPDRWTAMDESWRILFTAETQRTQR